ncbi:arginine--tRNA ligase [Candidatus Hikarchaeum yamanae]|uniref:arginine--tRNA ligase n=1 Tax=Candidatus Hikarchaeum yamanae TaxID=2675326 RepID=UPI0039E913D5|tara:strand:+ start:895 stop:2637 length:1743 start_codon:yes stop_codon:yes gene_type:complete
MLLAMRSEVENAFECVCSQLDLHMSDFGLEEPPEEVEAILASNIAYRVQKEMGKPPSEVAGKIVKLLDLENFQYVDRVYAEGPYINFVPSAKYFKETLEGAQEENYGQFQKRGETVIVEHTSANPTGPVHVGRARNPIIGDSISRILSFAGYQVERQYYVNDSGKQVATLIWAFEKFNERDMGDLKKDRGDYDIVRYYQLSNVYLENSSIEDKNIAELEIADILGKIESGDEEIYQKLVSITEMVLEGMKECLYRISVEFDEFIRETKFIQDGSVDEMVDRLKQLDSAFQEDGAWKLGIPGEEKPLVFLRSDGTSLYTTRDLCYHEWKLERADKIVTILGEDHKFQAEQLTKTLSLLGAETSRIRQVFYSWVNLPEGGMSTRKGTGINLDDLLDESVKRARGEVTAREGSRIREMELKKSDIDRISRQIGIGAIRCGIVATQPGKGITFDWDDALSFERQGAPYMQYVHARCCGILAKQKSDIQGVDSTLLNSKEELDLLHEISRLPFVVSSAAEALEPHRIITYAQKLAEKFNIFYRECPVLKGTDSELMAARLSLVTATKNAMSNSLYLVGIESPDSM